MKLNFRRFVAILLVAMMTLTALPTAGIAEVMQDVSRESGSIRTLMVEPDDETYYTYEFYDEDGTTLITRQIVKSGDTLLEPAAPAKANKKFVQWNPQVTFGPVDELTGENKTIKVTAEYTEVYYVFFVDNNGRVVTTKEAADGEPVTTADVLFPVEADHAITGWYTDAKFTTPVTTVTIDKANVTLYAKVEAGHWLTFDSKGGSYVAPVFVPNGKTATQPDNPTRPGYTFAGWEFDFTKELMEDATATANWTANDRTQYTVIHWQENADDDEYSYVESETRYDATGATTAAVAKRYTGFTAQTIAQQTIAGDGSTIVNVYYRRNVYSVKFYDQWGSSEYTKYRITAKYGANIRNKWPGGGWYVSKSSYNSTAQTNIDVMPLNGKSFYGKQSGNQKYTASYYIEVLPGAESSGTRMPNGKYYKLDHQDTTNSSGRLTVTDEDRYPMTGFTVNTSLSTRNGSSYNGAKFYYDRDELKVIYINVSTTVKEASYKYQQDISKAGDYTLSTREDGFTFAGWYADADGKVPYDFNGKTMPAQNITVYAKWKAPTYTVTFIDHNDKQYGDVATVDKGATVAEPEYTVSLSEDEQFLGWVLVDGTPFNFATEINQNYVLYAKVASKAAYSVIYDANGGFGDVPVDGQKYAEGALADVKPADELTPPQGKEIFLGWSTNPEATTAEVYPYGKLTIGTADVTLYAIWGVRENTVAITYKGNGGALADGQTEYTSSSLPNNGMIEVAQNTFVKAGYNFVSWNTQADGKGTSFAPGAEARVNGEGENVLYAIWEARTDTKYIVEFYYQNTDGTYPTEANESVERKGTTDTVVEVKPEDKNPRENNQYVWDETADNITSGTVSAVEPLLVLKLYFKLNTAPYTIHHYLLDTEIPVAEDQTGTMTIGEELTAEPAANRMAGTNEHSYAPRKTITITADPNANVITVYYTKNVTFTGQSDTRTYTGSEQELIGIEVEGLLDGDTWTGLSYSARGTDVGEYTGAFTGEQKIMHAGKEATYYNVIKTPGMLKITPNTDKVTVTITGNHDSKVYNGSEQSVTGYTTDVGEKTITVALKDGKVAEAKGTNVDTYYMGLTKDDFTVTSQNYSNIKVVVVDGYLEITPITTEITITAASDSKKYDGTPLTNAGYTYTQNVLLEGDVLTAVVEGSATNVGDEGKNVVKSYKVMRGSVDVTGNYTFTDSVDGKLTINPREVTLASETATKEYDGTPLTRPNVTEGGDGFVAGEVSNIVATGSVTYVSDGTVDNTITYTTSESFKADNYTISETVGKLSITKRSEVIVITTPSRTRAYNGDRMVDYQTTHTGTIIEGDRLVLLFPADAGLTDAGSKDNAYASCYVERISDGKNVTDNYTFGEPVIGTLTVTPVEIELTAASDSKMYDGTPLTNGNYTITKGSFATYTKKVDGVNIEVVEGLESVTVVGSQTTVGSSANTITGHALKENTKAQNYEITYQPGELKVTQNDKVIVVTANSHTWEYDGQPHTDGGYTVKYDGMDYTAAAGESVELPTGDKLTAKVEGTVTNVADSADDNNVVTDVTIVNGNGDPVNDQYKTITRIPGGLKITPRGAGEQKVLLTAADNTVVYDGQAHGAKLNAAGEIEIDTSYTITYLAEGHSVQTVAISGSQTNAGRYPEELVPASAIIVDENGNDVTANYLVTYVNGDLEITPVAEEVVVTITEHGGKAKYDGTEHVVKGYDVTSISNPLYTEADFAFNGKAEVKGIDAGSYPMLLKSADFVNTSGNFAKVTFVIVDATLEIEKREVTLTSASDEKVYDGKTLTNDEVTISGDGFAEGEGVYCGVTGRQLNVGESDNEFTYELLRGTKAGNYKITKEYGTLKVTPVTEEIVVTITGHKDSAKYDGTEKTVTGYDVSVSNDLYQEKDFTFSGDATASGIHAGKYPMGLKAEDFKNTSENFANVKFVVEDGEMEIQKIALTITSESYEGDYDAQWHEVGYTAEGLAATDAITALEMKNHRILKPGEMVSEFVADTLKITHADGSDATGDYEVTFVPGKLTVNTVIVNYRVFYYYDGVLDESEIEEGTGEVLTQITEYEDKPKDMQFDHVTGFPLTLGLDETKNIIRVYYVHTPLTGNLGAANIGDCIE